MDDLFPEARQMIRNHWEALFVNKPMRQVPLFRDRFKIDRKDFDGDFVFASKGNWWMSNFDEDIENWKVPDMGGLLFITNCSWNLLLRTIGIEVDEWEGVTYTIFTFSVATLEREFPKLHKPRFSEEPAHEEQEDAAISEIPPIAGKYDPWKAKAKCRAKVQYHSMHEADAAAILYENHFGTPYSSYHCPVCHMIHLTTKIKHNNVSTPEIVEHSHTPFEILLSINSDDE